jgi:hypothetical protein
VKLHNKLIHAVAAGAMVLLGTCALLPGNAAAQSAADAAPQSTLSDQWKFRALLYFWGANINTTATFPGGNTASADISFSDLLRNLRMAGMGALEVQKGSWGAFTDVLYMNVGATKSTTQDGTIDGVPLPAAATLNTGIGLKALIWTLAGSYRVQSSPESEMDLFAGARLLSLEPTLSYSFNVDVGPFVGPGRSGSRTVKANDWDAVFGAKGRLSYASSPAWFIPYYADIGTGDTDLTWQVSAGVGYSFSWGDVLLTYRYLDYKFKSSDVLDAMTMKGPSLGVALNW